MKKNPLGTKLKQTYMYMLRRLSDGKFYYHSYNTRNKANWGSYDEGDQFFSEEQVITKIASMDSGIRVNEKLGATYEILKLTNVVQVEDHAPDDWILRVQAHRAWCKAVEDFELERPLANELLDFWVDPEAYVMTKKFAIFMVPERVSFNKYTEGFTREEATRFFSMPKVAGSLSMEGKLRPIINKMFGNNPNLKVQRGQPFVSCKFMDDAMMVKLALGATFQIVDFRAIYETYKVKF